MNQRHMSVLLIAGLTLCAQPCIRAAEEVRPTTIVSIDEMNAILFSPEQQAHIDWVTDALLRMQTVKLGMTRKQLHEVFRGDGGIYVPLQRTYVSRDCPLFKVDVEFEAVGRPARDSDGRVTKIEADQDRITKISKPYLDFPVND